jgi:pimeloyl-ACP methyl ester carboxylesterase
MTAPSLPEPIGRLDLEMNDGASIVVLRHGNTAGPRLVISHGNGFATDGYYPFWRLALARFEVVLFDMRNHGRNPYRAGLEHSYPAFLADFEAVHRAVGEQWSAKTTIGAFHSMSALTALRAAVEGTWHWDALVLFDPPVMPPPGHREFELMVSEGSQIFELVAGRIERFADPADLARVFARRFTRWVPGTAEWMAQSVVRRDPENGDWLLACPRALESPMYLANRTFEMWPVAADLARPTMLICADPNAATAESVAKSCAALHEDGGIRYAALPKTGHFLQLEQPEDCFRLMEGFLAEAGVAT